MTASTFRVAFYDNVKAPDAAVLDLSWDELVTLFSEHDDAPCKPHTSAAEAKRCRHKDGPLWSPVKLTKPYRDDKNVETVTLAVFDFDHLSAAETQDAFQKLKDYAYVAHTTHSHLADGADDQCWRVVVPLTHPVPATEWKQVRKAIVERLQLPTDPTCKDRSRAYYRPLAPTGAERAATSSNGQWISPAEFRSVAPPKSEPLILPDEETNHVDLGEVREALAVAARKKARSRASDPEKQERDKLHALLLSRILKNEPLAEPGERDNMLNIAMTACAFAVHPATPFEALKLVLMPSVTAMARPDDADDPVKHWLTEAEDMYNRACTRRLELETQNAEAVARLKAGFAAIVSSRKQPPPKVEEKAIEDEEEHAALIAKDQHEAGEEGDWRKLLRRDDKGIMNVPMNVTIILSYDTDRVGLFRFNEVTKGIEVVGGMFKDVHPSVLPVALADWLSSEWGVHQSPVVVEQRILLIARKNAYDPIRDFLTSLKWDGTARLDDWLTTYCHAATVNADGEDIAPLIKQISAKWMIGLVARGLKPGTKVDTVLVLEGSQGLGKSSAFRVIGGEWFTDSKIVFGDKDTYMLAASSWIIELAEMVAFKRAEEATHKSFLGANEDTYRPPYGRTTERSPRRCVFVGTTNDEEYLTDTTGNRRYWSIYCNEVFDLEGLRKVRNQLLAEAVARFNAGEVWWFDFDENRALEEKITKHRMRGDEAYEDTLRKWWTSSKFAKRGFVTTAEVMTHGLQLAPDRCSRAEQIRVGNTLRVLGFKRVRRLVDGARAYVYEPPKVWPVLDDRARHLKLIASSDASKGEVKS